MPVPYDWSILIVYIIIYVNHLVSRTQSQTLCEILEHHIF